jgi:hypothetical protein
MVNILIGLLFLSGMPFCMFVLPTSWWPWSLFGWFFGFIAFERFTHAVSVKWRGQPRPACAAGIAIGLAIAIHDASGAGDGGGDGGSDGDGDGDGGGGD